ncbi:DUF5684 domain-containing protein [Microbacterium sp. SLBN-146]|uniref:DUF5684 domain-containing protein n=1 Tax=Microbacterium sp. SLBN-146 TaxID=2768457 RepID=UPI00114EB124|nr:DUF5684 domain-containing protein [Microbacterium sp. SLBN-146]TQJ29759.1 FHA domain-containing protein [Microbacterium sp. SLBN-146]
MNVFADTTTAATAGVVTFLVFAAVYVWTALALAAVFRKSGEAGWQAWVPILNSVVLFRLGGQSPWLLLLLLIPGLGAIAVWIVQIVACHRIGRDFQVGPGMTVLAALLFPVWASVLGFGSSRWVGEEEEAGPRRIGDTAPPVEPVSQESAESAEPATATPEPVLRPDPVTPIGELPFHARSTHVSAPDPVFSTSSEAVAPPAPAPGRPTPFAPTAPSAESFSGPVPPRAVRSGSPVPPPAGGWAAPAQSEEAAVDDDADAAGPARRRGAYDPTLHVVEDTGEVTGAVTGAPAPLAAVPSADPLFLPPVTRVPLSEPRSAAAEPWAPSRSSESDSFAETSGPVSAIAGAPDAGSPRSALSSVSAQNRRPQIPDDVIEETIIARRRRTDWSLVPPAGGPVAIGAEVVLLGRRPTADPAHPGAQLISIDDGTVSKTHARLELRDEKWFVTDLNSTNGVVFATLLGTEVEATPGVAIEAGDRFLLGDAEIRLVRSTE